MSIKNLFEKFLHELDIVPSERLSIMPSSQFGGLFFEFARRSGYDIANNNRMVLDRLDLDIKEVVDVGVHDGTPWLYGRYPNSRFVLVEPQRDAELRLRSKPSIYVLINKAVGESPGTLELTEREERSSLLNRADSSKLIPPEGERYAVPVVTLDTIIKTHCETDAIGLKIDVEGFEYFAIKGLDTEMHRVQFIIIEVSIRNRFVGEHSFGEITALLMGKGFRFYNIMNTARPAPPNAYDMIFLPKHSSYFDIDR